MVATGLDRLKLLAMADNCSLLVVLKVVPWQHLAASIAWAIVDIALVATILPSLAVDIASIIMAWVASELP